MSLAPQALWKLKQVIEALGGQVPKALVRLDTDRLVGKRALIRVIHEPWTDAEGVRRFSAKVEAVFPLPTTGSVASAVGETAPDISSDIPEADNGEPVYDDIPF